MKTWKEKIFRGFIIMVIIWMVGCFASFLSGICITFLGSPSWLPLPWSGFDDFVQSPDGKVFVDIEFYSRVLCYNESGKFLASYPYPFGNAKDTGLAVDHNGRIFFRTQHWLYIYDVSWNLLEKDEGEFDSSRNWRLDEEGQPVFVLGRQDVSVPNRAAVAGEYIFSKSYKRSEFTCMNGSRLVRKDNHLERHSVQGELLATYNGPRILSLFTFPWPAFLAWPLAFLFGYAANKKKSFLEQRQETQCNMTTSANIPKILTKYLLIDVVVTAGIFIITAAAIVIGGAVVIAIANALPENNPMQFWLVPIVVIPYWIIVIIVALKSWRLAQSRLRRMPHSKLKN
ncbi:MAG: hypothetical protein KAJ46_01355 [Sedimentisphaerales bacterium]|nr:hypothetical protein [Sedimentisphaerales bacterium]